jgi:hypothetical protein
VFDRAATAEEPDVRNTHFLFVDPPSLEAWPDIQETLRPERAAGTLLWLPVLEDGGGAADDAALVDAWSLGYARVTVRWSGPARTIGARLLHRLPPEAAAALDAAVDHVSALAGWTVTREV